ncbi:hypothetical protein BOSEA31B_14992 [Hyphomicrobiales bacterium]|nr:hypothetical protein BOSEA31B_14992 [Hyphomicrobiales bacterium]CAH1701478.1 hypothetical protein BOSEA1005_21177 [Hyphomicrobiales bacterium]CAI0345435.1 hypothetical protein BO1005MUT1_390107 [Hyphomicrobiales bacterium]
MRAIVRHPARPHHDDGRVPQRPRPSHTPPEDRRPDGASGRRHRAEALALLGKQFATVEGELGESSHRVGLGSVRDEQAERLALHHDLVRIPRRPEPDPAQPREGEQPCAGDGIDGETALLCGAAPRPRPGHHLGEEFTDSGKEIREVDTPVEPALERRRMFEGEHRSLALGRDVRQRPGIRARRGTGNGVSDLVAGRVPISHRVGETSVIAAQDPVDLVLEPRAAEPAGLPAQRGGESGPGPGIIRAAWRDQHHRQVGGVEQDRERVAAVEVRLDLVHAVIRQPDEARQLGGMGDGPRPDRQQGRTPVPEERIAFHRAGGLRHQALHRSEFVGDRIEAGIEDDVAQGAFKAAAHDVLLWVFQG